MTQSLPTVGASADAWGAQLNNWLLVAHNADGTLVNIPVTAVQTSNYTASATQLVPVDTTSGSITVTLPTTPENGVQLGVKHVVQGNTSNVPNVVTVTAGGSDVFNKAGGGTSVTLKLSGQGVFIEYGSGIWYVISDDLPLGQLDIRYPFVYNVKTYGATGNGSTDDTAAIQAAINAVTGSASPAANTRAALGPLYLPPGAYKVTSDLVIQSVENFTMTGAGSGQTIIYASGAGFTQAVLFINGSADGVFQGFDIRGDGTEASGSNPLPDGIRLDWVGSSRVDSCGTTSSSAVVTNVDARVYDVGATVTGTNVPSSTVVSSVVENVSWTLSNTCTGSGTENLTATQLTANVSARSTTGNCFRDIRVRALKFVTGISLEGNSSVQVDGTTFENVIVTGAQTPGSWSSSGLYQVGFACGNGVFANNYDHRAMGLDVSGCYWGYKINASGLALHGAQPAGNGTDFWILANTQTTIHNVQSQSAGSFLYCPAQFSPSPVSFRDVTFGTFYPSSGYYFAQLTGGQWSFDNISVWMYQLPSTGYENPVITVAGDSTNRPCHVTFNLLSVYGAKTTCIVPTSSEANIVVTNYINYNPGTGFYASAVAGDLISAYTGSSWTNVV